MKTKKKRAILASVALIAMVAMTVPVFASPSDRDLPAESEPFWTIFAAMDSPTDYEGCVAAATSYVNSQNFSRTLELGSKKEICDISRKRSHGKSDGYAHPNH